jgi:hypothetical protein
MNKCDVLRSDKPARMTRAEQPCAVAIRHIQCPLPMHTYPKRRHPSHHNSTHTRFFINTTGGTDNPMHSITPLLSLQSLILLKLFPRQLIRIAIHFHTDPTPNFDTVIAHKASYQNVTRFCPVECLCALSAVYVPRLAKDLNSIAISTTSRSVAEATEAVSTSPESHPQTHSCRTKAGRLHPLYFFDNPPTVYLFPHQHTPPSLQ